MSGVVSGVVTHKLNQSRDERKFRRQRLEEVFVAFMGFTKDLSLTWMRMLTVMQGHLDYIQALDLEIAARSGDAQHLDKLDMLIVLYWPEMTPHLKRLMATRDKGGDAIIRHKERYTAGHRHDQKSSDAITALLHELDQLEKDFAAAARAEAVKLQGVG